jgi:hypothetical protein
MRSPGTGIRSLKNEMTSDPNVHGSAHPAAQT